MAKELYVGHISEQATEDDLRKLFSLMGPVTSVHLIVNQETGEFKRCGYVRMLASVDLKEVVETLDGTWLIDRCIVVSVAKPQKDRPAKTSRTGRKPAGAGRPDMVKSSFKSGQPAIAKDNVKKERPVAAKDKAGTERPPRAGRAAKGSLPASGRKAGGTPKPASKGRR